MGTVFLSVQDIRKALISLPYLWKTTLGLLLPILPNKSNLHKGWSGTALQPASEELYFYLQLLLAREQV